MAEQGEITRLLGLWRDGDAAAEERLLSTVYAELKVLARSHLRRERAHHSLGASDLVHEVFLRLQRQQAVDWQNRSHFFGIAAQAMRRLLVDHARRKRVRDREDPVVFGDPEAEIGPEQLLTLDRALSRLAAADPRQAKVVELRFFAGFSVLETAEVLGVAEPTVKRDWRAAKLWLQREMTRDPASP